MDHATAQWVAFLINDPFQSKADASAVLAATYQSKQLHIAFKGGGEAFDWILNEPVRLERFWSVMIVGMGYVMTPHRLHHTASYCQDWTADCKKPPGGRSDVREMWDLLVWGTVYTHQPQEMQMWATANAGEK